MKSLFVPIFLNIVFATLLFGQSNSANHDSEEQIRLLIDQYSQARETKDPELITSILTKDIDQLVSSGTWRRGFDASLAGMMKSSAQRPGTRTLTVETIRFLNETTAIVDARYEVQNTDGSTRKMWSCFIVTKDDRWKIAAIRNMLPAK